MEKYALGRVFSWDYEDCSSVVEVWRGPEVVSEISAYGITIGRRTRLTARGL